MKILFVGNSHTFMNDMPQLAKEMIMNATGEECEVFMLAYGGRSLKWHMSEEYFAVRFNLLHGNFDYCVMQEVAHPMTDEEDTYSNIRRITELCRKSGTIPVVFETWAEKAKPYNQQEMNRRYQKITEETGAELAEIGKAWSMAAEADPSIELYWKDGEHASPIGDYLAALVITKTITGKLPDKFFLRAYDFTGAEMWHKVKETVSEEYTEIPAETAELFHRILED